MRTKSSFQILDLRDRWLPLHSTKSSLRAGVRRFMELQLVHEGSRALELVGNNLLLRLVKATFLPCEIDGKHKDFQTALAFFVTSS